VIRRRIEAGLEPLSLGAYSENCAGVADLLDGIMGHCQRVRHQSEPRRSLKRPRAP